MTQLVFIENNKPVTDSLTVAESFDKAHDKVLRDIRELGCSEEFRLANFGESTYINAQRRRMPRVVMTEQGFTMLAMGYTGPKAMEFKERYISEFHRMRETLTQTAPALDSKTAIAIALRETAEMMVRLPMIEGKVAELDRKLDEQVTLAHGEQRAVQRAIGKRVYTVAEETGDETAPMFRQLHREIKDRWAVGSYVDVRRKDLQDVLRYIAAWRPRRDMGGNVS